MSGSFDNGEYSQLQDFAEDFVDEFSDDGKHFDGEKGLKMGVMGFSTTTNLFTNNPMLKSDYVAIKAAIKKTRQTGGTYTNLCFNHAGVAFDLATRTETNPNGNTFGDVTWTPNTNNQGARDKVEKIILLLTDGKPSNAADSWQAATDAMAAGITILGVGVGVPDVAAAAEIKKMVSAPEEKHYISVDNPTQLKDKLAAIVKGVCIVNCKGIWGSWGACNQQTGKQERTFTVTDPGDTEGAECPTIDVKDCRVNCVWHRDPWIDITCDVVTEQVQPTVVDVIPRNGGTPCPSNNTRTCKPCVFHYHPWAPATCAEETLQTEVMVVDSLPEFGGTACPLNNTRTCTPCVFRRSPWTPSTCSSTTTQVEKTVIDALPTNGGQTCPPDNTRVCQPCVFHYLPWTPASCSGTTQQTEPMVIDIAPQNNGTACPADHHRICQPCVFHYDPWTPSSCTVTLEQTEPMIVDTPPSGGGSKCPRDNTRTCSPCFFHWTNWTVCDIATGRQTRDAVVTEVPQNGGTPCPPSEERSCAVPCQYKWSPWICDKHTGRKKRQPIISSQPLNGWDGYGAACPSEQEENCQADCEGAWGCWSPCATPNYLQPPWTKYRDFVVAVGTKNGGRACPTRETKKCLPDVCFSGESGSSQFGAKMEGMVPLRHLPPVHPAFARTGCGGPLESGWLSSSSSSTDVWSPGADVSPSKYWLPPVDAGKSKECTGPELWYAVDATTSRTGTLLDKEGKSRLFWLQDGDGRLHYGVLNGVPAGGASVTGHVAADYTFKLDTNVNPATLSKLSWESMNDPPLDLSKSCSAQNGNDCYSWDELSKKAKAKWSWTTYQNSGGILGPLPSYGFCLTMTAGDVSGVDTYEFIGSDVLVGGTSYLKEYPFDAGALDYYLKVCTYLCPKAESCRENGDDVWDNSKSNVVDGGGGGGGGGSSSGGGSGSSGSSSGGGGGSSGSASGSGSSGGSSGGSSSSGSSSSSSGSSSGSGSSGIATGSGTSTAVSGSGTDATAGATTGSTTDSGTSGGTGVTGGSSSDGTTGTRTTTTTGSGGTRSTGGSANDGGSGAEDDGGSSSGGGDNAATNGNGNDSSSGEDPTNLTGGDSSDARNGVRGDGTSAGESDGSDSPLNAIVCGGVAGGLLLFLLLGLLVHRRGKRKGSKRAVIGENNLPAGWSMFVDPATGYPCYVDPSGNSQWDPPQGMSNTAAIGIELTNTKTENPMRKQAREETNRHHARASTTVPSGWEKMTTEEGDRYYMDGKTGDTTWDAPAGSTGGSTGIEEDSSMLNSEHTRSETVLPSGWGKDEHEGDKFYFNEKTGETAWEAPEGSSGGSTGIPMGSSRV